MMVEVDGKKMYVYFEGEGDKIIFLMFGLGSIVFLIDFKLLIEELKSDFRVVVVEFFGYGFSDEIIKEWSVENIIDEIRMVFKEVNIDGLYIFMFYFILGIYV